MKPVALKKRFPFSAKRVLPLNAALPILSLLWLAAPVNAADLSAHEHGVAHLALAQDGKEISVSFTAAADSVIGYEHAPTNDKELEALHHAEEVLYHPEKWLTLPISCEMEEREVSLPFLSPDGHKERHHADDHDEHDHDENEHAARDHDEHDHDENEHAAHDHDEHDHDENEHAAHDHDEHDHDEHDHDENEHAAHDHDEHDHDENEHAAHDHDEHDHEGHDHEGGHVDVEASYTFHCDSEQASPLELKLFSQLPYLELLRIEAVSERTVVVTEREGDGKLEW